MKQKVHSVSYFAKAEFEFKNGVYDLVALPTGAEVLKVSLEAVGNVESGSVSIGFKDEATKDYFLNLDKTYFSVAKTAPSIKEYTATSNKVIVAEVKNANLDGVKGILRVLYFLPSVIEVEY